LPDGAEALLGEAGIGVEAVEDGARLVLPLPG
jgi:hypothetical protein